MNAKQLAALQRLTNTMEQVNRLNSGEPLDGVLTWTLELQPDGKYMVSASNANDQLLWFHRHMFLIGIVGTRGGIRFLRREGFPCLRNYH